MYFFRVVSSGSCSHIYKHVNILTGKHKQAFTNKCTFAHMQMHKNIHSTSSAYLCAQAEIKTHAGCIFQVGVCFMFAQIMCSVLSLFSPLWGTWLYSNYLPHVLPVPEGDIMTRDLWLMKLQLAVFFPLSLPVGFGFIYFQSYV